jgi:hypothetical protein
MKSFDLKMFQDHVNKSFLNDLEYMIKISPDNAEEHFDTCMSVSYKKYRHYPNYWACRKGLSMVCKTIVWGYL